MTQEQHAQAEAEGTELLIAALKERNAALEADKRRLDWLEQRHEYNSICLGSVLLSREVRPHGDGWICGCNQLGGYFDGDTARQAIDAAMEAQP